MKATLDKAIKYTATLPNGQVVTRKSKRVIHAVHCSINTEDNTCWAYRFTENNNPLTIASASSCGVNFSFCNLNRCYSPQQKARAREDNIRAEQSKAEYERTHTFHIIPVVAA
jgi:hypothetical protein